MYWHGAQYQFLLSRGKAMIAKVVSAVALITIAIGFQGCGGKEPVPASSRFAVEFQVTNDEGDALAGARVAAGKLPIGMTENDGSLKVELSGAEGQILLVSVVCPDGYTGPEKPAVLRLTHTRHVNREGYQATHFESICTRNLRDIVVVVRAEGGAGLALHVDGKPSGTTDADGIAHVLVHADRTVKSLYVNLDTSARQDLRPKNPSRTYELAGNDAVLVFAQAFVAVPKSILHGAGTKPRKHIPYRVN
jgi:hypothetical protein